MFEHHNRKRAMLTMGLAAAIAFAGLQGGCAKNAANGDGSSIKPQSYANDGYLGRTNANPHIPGRHMALGYKNDAAMIQTAIKNVPGVAGSSVTFNGADAYVTIKLKPGLQAREIPTVESQAASVLRFNFPRYNVHVRSMK